MSTLLAHGLTIIVVALAALFGLRSFDASSTAYVIMIYALWISISVFDRLSRPNSLEIGLLLLPEAAGAAFRKYHLYIRTPGGAAALSALLNNCRLIGIVWGGVCIWHEIYPLGAAAIFFFFLSGGLILRLNPWLYMGAQAQRGNAVAMHELQLISAVQERMQSVSDEPQT